MNHNNPSKWWITMLVRGTKCLARARHFLQEPPEKVRCVLSSLTHSLTHSIHLTCALPPHLATTDYGALSICPSPPFFQKQDLCDWICWVFRWKAVKARGMLGIHGHVLMSRSSWIWTIARIRALLYIVHDFYNPSEVDQLGDCMSCSKISTESDKTCTVIKMAFSCY
jgi:hypothetical protein